MINIEYEFEYRILTRQIPRQLEDIDIWANLCKNSFYPATINNENGAAATRKIVRTQTEAATPLVLKNET